MSSSDSQEAAKSLVESSIVIAGHTDFIADLGPRRRRGERNVMERHIPQMRSGGITAVCDHIGGDAPYYAVYPSNTTTAADPLKYALQALQHVRAEIAESSELTLALTADDIRDAHANGKIGVVICLEGAAPIEDDLSLIGVFHDLGVRCIGLTHNQRNLLADGIAVGAGGGLTKFGRRAVEEMQRLGIAVDVSHLAVEGFWDLMDVTGEPIIASHSNAAAVNPHPRNLDDDQIRSIAESGGVIGVHGMTTLINGRQDATLSELVLHIDHISELVGPSHVAVGPDIMPDWNEELYREIWSPAEDLRELTFSYPDDFTGLEEIVNLATALFESRYLEEDVVGILGQNWLRVFESLWDSADGSQKDWLE